MFDHLLLSEHVGFNAERLPCLRMPGGSEVSSFESLDSVSKLVGHLAFWGLRGEAVGCRRARQIIRQGDVHGVECHWCLLLGAYGLGSGPRERVAKGGGRYLLGPLAATWKEAFQA